MKKLLMAVAAVFAVASMASAAKIAWRADNQVLDDAGNPLNGGTAYLVYLGDGNLDAAFNGTSWDMGDDQIVGSTAIVGSIDTTYSSAWGTFGDTSTVPGGIGSKYTIIVTTDGVLGNTLPTTGYYGVSGIYEQTKDGPTDTEDYAYTGVIVANTAITPVPEPTTYALIGIAAAALALRKRFLKK